MEDLKRRDFELKKLIALSDVPTRIAESKNGDEDGLNPKLGSSFEEEMVLRPEEEMVLEPEEEKPKMPIHWEPSLPFFMWTDSKISMDQFSAFDLNFHRTISNTSDFFSNFPTFGPPKNN